VYADNRFTLNKKGGLVAQINYYYRSPIVQGTNTYSAMSNLTLSISKKFLDGNGELTLIGSDLLRGEMVRGTTQYANQYNYTESYGENRYFRMQFRYNFGNQKLDNGRARDKTDEQKRL
ncbi:MAG: TonB-dependent receptor, partial [Flavobacterium sp.]